MSKHHTQTEARSTKYLTGTFKHLKVMENKERPRNSPKLEMTKETRPQTAMWQPDLGPRADRERTLGETVVNVSKTLGDVTRTTSIHNAHVTERVDRNTLDTLYNSSVILN